MARNLTADDARQSLTAHVENKGLEIFHQHGGRLDWAGLQRLLEDRTQVRYPCEIVFDAGPLQEGEFAHPVPKGDTPEDGFAMHVHPIYMLDLEQVLAELPSQEAELLRLRYGINQEAPMALSAVARSMGVTRDTARGIERRANAAIRHRSPQVIDYLEA